MLKKFSLFLALAATLFTTVNAATLYPKTSPQFEALTLKTYDFEPKTEGSEKYFSSTFSKSDATYIYAMLYLRNFLYNIRDEDYTVTFKYFDGNNDLFGTFDRTYTIQKDWEYAYLYGGWGYKDPGNWKPGNYRVELWIGDQKLGEANFTITDK